MHLLAQAPEEDFCFDFHISGEPKPLLVWGSPFLVLHTVYVLKLQCGYTVFQTSETQKRKGRSSHSLCICAQSSWITPCFAPDLFSPFLHVLWFLLGSHLGCKNCLSLKQTLWFMLCYVVSAAI